MKAKNPNSKMSVCEAVFIKYVVIGEDGKRSMSKERKDIMDEMYDVMCEKFGKESMTINTIPAYYQQLRQEHILLTGKYAHHKSGYVPKAEREKKKEEVVVGKSGLEFLNMMNDIENVDEVPPTTVVAETNIEGSIEDKMDDVTNNKENKNKNKSGQK